jgi:hypothetical protein
MLLADSGSGSRFCTSKTKKTKNPPESGPETFSVFAGKEFVYKSHYLTGEAIWSERAAISAAAHSLRILREAQLFTRTGKTRLNQHTDEEKVKPASMRKNQCCRSGMFIPYFGSKFFLPGSRVKKIPDPGSGSKNFNIFYPKNCF